MKVATVTFVSGVLGVVPIVLLVMVRTSASATATVPLAVIDALSAVRVTITFINGGSPSPVDRIWATRLGVAAVELIVQGQSGVIPIRRNGDVEVVPITEVIKETRRVPKELYELTQVFV